MAASLISVTPPVFIRRSGTDRKDYLPKARSAIDLSIASLTADMLKLAPFCIGGNSIKVQRLLNSKATRHLFLLLQYR